MPHSYSVDGNKHLMLSAVLPTLKRYRRKGPECRIIMFGGVTLTTAASHGLSLSALHTAFEFKKWRLHLSDNAHNVALLRRKEVWRFSGRVHFRGKRRPGCHCSAPVVVTITYLYDSLPPPFNYSWSQRSPTNTARWFACLWPGVLNPVPAVRRGRPRRPQPGSGMACPYSPSESPESPWDCASHRVHK
jgi:hypothetical protein